MLCDTPAKRRRLQRRRPIDQSHRFESYHPSGDGGTGRHGRTRASTSSSPVANEVTVETNARLPMWFARNVRQVCDRLVSRSGRYRDTVRSETMIPSFSNSPWIRGAPQRQFSVAMRPTSFRSCKSMRSRRPPARATPPASTEPFARPTGDRGRLDQHESLPPHQNRRKHTQSRYPIVA